MVYRTADSKAVAAKMPSAFRFRPIEISFADLAGRGYNHYMTKLLQEAIDKLSRLPKEKQDELGRMLIDVAAQDLQPYVLAAEEQKALKESLAEVERGEFATDADVAALWQRFGV